MEEEDETGTGTGTGGITTNGDLLPGTTNPTPTTGIFRSEAKVESSEDLAYGNGFANNIAYDSTSDTFFVDGLAFDGSQPGGVPYSRSTPSNLGSYALYEAPATYLDPVTNNPITQFDHRALYGQSANTRFAIVRTGNYVNYGFGGFVYERDGSVVLPTQGQATYSGDYGGMRDFAGRGGLEYVIGDMQVDIDFAGFNNNCTGATCADAIRGYVFNRTIYNSNGTDVTAGYLAALNSELPADVAPATGMPVIQFRIGPNSMDSNGEATGVTFTSDPEGQVLDEGNYYLLLSGDHTATPGGEIVGIVVVEGEDPRFEDVTVRETGGFIVTR